MHHVEAPAFWIQLQQYRPLISQLSSFLRVTYLQPSHSHASGALPAVTSTSFANGSNGTTSASYRYLRDQARRFRPRREKTACTFKHHPAYHGNKRRDQDPQHSQPQPSSPGELGTHSKARIPLTIAAVSQTDRPLFSFSISILSSLRSQRLVGSDPRCF